VPVLSAGLVLHRAGPHGVELLVAHMGGPFWARKDEGAWTFPKGLVEAGEEPLAAARRELAEELGVPAPPGPYVPLGEVRQSGKVVVAWAVAADLDPSDVVPGTFELEWPPRSGRTQSFPEVDRVAWVPPDDATRLLVKAQRGLVPRVLDVVGGG
jgi:predicted NUDIX family NTP pyrophosphohydrolase